MDFFDLQPIKPLKSSSIVPGRSAEPVSCTELTTTADCTLGVYRGAPNVTRRMFVCMSCKAAGKRAEFRFQPEEIGLYHASSGTPYARGAQQQGYVHGYAKCHGDHCEFAAPYPQCWAAIDGRIRIELFGAVLPSAEEPAKIECVKLALPQSGPITIDV